MHVLLQHSTFYPHAEDESGDAVLALARALSRRGHRVDVLASTGRCARSRVPAATRLSERRVEDVDGVVFEAASHGHVDVIDPWQANPSRLRRTLHRWASRRSARWQRLTREVIRARRPDLLHSHGLSGLTVSVWKAAHDAGVPLVHSLRDTHLLEFPAPRASAWVDLVVSPSRFLLERHRARGMFADVRAEIVPEVSGPPVVPMPVRDTPRIPRVLVLGPLTVEHGVALAIDLFENWFEDPATPPLTVSFAGNGPLETKVRGFCSSWSTRAAYHGRVDARTRERLLRESDLLLVPTLADVMCTRAAHEGARHALPVLATTRAGLEEQIEDAITGTLVEPTSEALHAALLEYVLHPALRHEHGRRAYERAARASHSDPLETLLALYGSLEREVVR